MTFLTPEETKLQVDSRGRVRVSVERREALLDEFEKSGLSARAFARLVGINATTFSAWDLRRRKRGGAKKADVQQKPLQFLEAAVEPAAKPQVQGWQSALVVELVGGTRIEVVGPGQLPLVAQLIRLVAADSRREDAC